MSLELDLNSCIDPSVNDWFDNQWGGAGNFYEITKTETLRSVKWKCVQLRYTIKFFQVNESFSSVNQKIQQVFEYLYRDIYSQMNVKDCVSINFTHPQLLFPICTQLLYRDDISPNFLMRLIERVCQSGRDVRIDQELTAYITIANNPIGKGRLDGYAFKCKGVRIVSNKDSFCLVRAILIAQASLEKDKFYQKMCNLSSTELDKRTLEMVKCLNLTSDGLGIKDIEKIEKFLKFYQITCYDGDGITSNILYTGKTNYKYLYIWHHNNHYDAITSITSFLKKKYYCHNCKKAFTKIGDHNCQNICKLCRRPTCRKAFLNICSHCKKECNNEVCLRIHTERFCFVTNKCTECGFFKNKRHVCGFDAKWCTNCKASVDKDSHKCCILTEKDKKRRKHTFDGYIFFDYEPMVIDNKHIPNLVCTNLVCKNCLTKKNNSCTRCNEKVFFSNESFCSWLIEQNNFIALAHNMRAYDGVFILNYIINNLVPSDRKPNSILQGSKILCLSFNKIKIIDSYSFIPIALEKFSESFDINETKKGFFPHLFNIVENQNYIGKIPDKKYFNFENFSKEKLSEFEKWYEKSLTENKIYNFKEELISYCQSDVKLLTEGCLAFRKIIIDLTTQNNGEYIDPFKNSITLASLCHLIYRTNIMKSNSIAYIPNNGPNSEKNSSFKAHQWLHYISKINNVKIRNANDGGEVSCGGYRIDGFCEETNYFYEFHGCFFHGCLKCFSNETFNPVLNLTMGTINQRHIKRIEYIRSINSNLVEIWECEWDNLLKNDLNVKKILESYMFSIPINPRDALFGGRTNAVKLYHLCSNDEKIKYIDIISLYPCVQKYCEYPIGHPIFILKDFKELSNYFGLIKCRILPPRKLFYPVLPLPISGKLVFPLCLKCATDRKEECNHKDSERAIEGTWCSIEVLFAQKRNYKILNVYEVWHWNESQKGFFEEYVNLFLKGNAESSGYPSYVKTEEEKDNYIKKFWEKENVILEKGNIKKINGKRFVYKRHLNSFWGRFGMNSDKTHYKIITNPNEWFEMLNNDQFIIQSVDIANENCIQVYYKNKFNETHIDTNVVIAAFVTAHARLRLLEEIEKIGERVLYFDTDSIIFISKENEYEPKLGDFLGEFTSETKNNHIIEFVSAGPKNYAYKLDNGETKCVVKGFALDNLNGLNLKFESIKNIVKYDQDQKIKIRQQIFKRNKTKWEITSQNIDKEYGFVYDKRILNEDFTTIPYGY